MKRVFPTRVGDDSDWTHISSGQRHTCGIRNNGELFCWGSNSVGQLGNGTNGSSNDPQDANQDKPFTVGTNSDWVNISLGTSHTCGFRDSQLFCWGSNVDGKLGNATTSRENIPTLVYPVQ